MSPRILVVVQRLALLTAILASAALIIDYTNVGDPTFCGTQSACFRVRDSGVGRDLAGYAARLSFFGGKTTVPHLGLAAHVGLLFLALFAASRFWVRLVAGVASLGAAAAVFLLVAQLRMGELCPWCAVVDVASIVCAAASVLLARATPPDPEPSWRREAHTGTSVVVWAAAALGMAALPQIWFNFSSTAPLPAPIQALQVPGKVTVVSFTDFECPYCRNLAPTLAPIHDDPQVAFKRLMAPLDMHPGAKPAALAYLCVDDDMRDDYARLLYEAPDGAFSPGNLEWIAVNKGKMKKSREDFEACMQSPETEKRLQEDVAIFKDSGSSGLPTTFVGRRMVKGFQPDKVLAALAAEKRGSSLTLPIWAMFVAAAAIAGWTVAMHVRSARAHADAASEAEARARRAEEADEADDDEASSDDEGAPKAKPKGKPKKARRQPQTTPADTPSAKRSRSSDALEAVAEPKDESVVGSDEKA